MMAAAPTSNRLNEKNRKNVDRFSKLTNRSRTYTINQALDAYVQDRIAYVE